MKNFQTVARVGEIPEGEGRAFEVGDRMIAVFNDAGVLRAMDDMCPHMGASLATGFLEDSIVACPWHAWRFDTRDGTWCDNRRLKIDVFEIRIVDNEIQVEVPEQPTNELGNNGSDDNQADNKLQSSECKPCAKTAEPKKESNPTDE